MFGKRDFITPSIPTFQVPATIADKLLGVVSSYITVHFYKYAEKHQRVVQKSTCAHLKFGSMSLARTIKARNGKYYKSNAESIRSRKRDNYQNNPQNKKDASRASYKADPNKAKETARKQ